MCACFKPVWAHRGIPFQGQRHPVQVLIRDDTSDAGRVATIISEAVNDSRVSAVIAPYSSGLTAVSVPLMEGRQVSHFAANNTPASPC
jgi:ABC-type branched-subunit amino acid transport system substrate-binding protein